MNRRQWKKACKKAAAEIARRWPGEYDFVPADGDETVSPPRGYVPARRKPAAGVARRLWRLEFQYAGPPRGTPLYWTHDSYTNESECATALDVLNQRDFEESFDWEAEARKLDTFVPPLPNNQESVK